jgi:serine phosphatase RsbU (regulator of sigma subunit)
MKKIILYLFICHISFLNAKDHIILLNSETLNTSLANQAELCKDENNHLTIDALISGTSKDFMSLKHKVENIDFTNSTFWLKFTVLNQTQFSDFIIETARPITNLVEFYEVKNGKILKYYQNGDDIRYIDKPIKNRKVLFPTHINQNEQKTYYIKLKSDGEVISLPLIIYDRDTFYQTDTTRQFLNGLYYGILFIVFIIYAFFAYFLQDKTFFYYIAYVAGVFLLQFSLDGYSFQYIFPNSNYWANHIVLFSASIAVLLVLQYAKSYLNLKKNSARFYKWFSGLQITILLFGVMSLIPGKVYELMYPVINAVSLVSILLILFTIYYLKRKGISICNYFTSAFTVLIIGAVIFILGNFNIVFNPIISQNALKLSSGLEVVILSISMAKKYREIQQAKEELQKEALKNLEEKNKIMDTMNIQLEQQVKDRTQEIIKQKELLENRQNILEEQNKEILSSIRYAERIQTAILPSESHIKQILPESFIFYKPKDVVSGDFYFIEETITSNSGDKLALFAAVDCTGHGVPGAFMSIVGNNFLRQSVQEENVNSTGEALDYLNQGVCKTLRQNFNNSPVRDGMDIAFCALNFEKLELYFSGAKNSVVIIRDEILPEIKQTKRNPVVGKDGNLFLNEIKGDSHPIGAYIGEELKPFKTHKVKLKKGDKIYLFSDGFSDQFGGDKGKKYNIKRFKLFLLSISHLPMDKQKEMLEQEFSSWKGDLEQIDDVCVIGVSV